MTGKCDVAIIGAGPAGLSAAIRLRHHGVKRVVVLEREDEAGGIPRHCGHPPFGLREFGRLLTGPSYARRLRVTAERAGVEIRLRHSITGLHPSGTLSFASPSGEGTLSAQRVILATGARETPRSTRLVSGVRPVGILNTGALQAYVHISGLIPFRRPVIVGTELVSLSALATCRSHGICPVAVIEEKPVPTARWPLTLFPRLLGVPTYYASRIECISGSPRVESVDVRLADGSIKTIACDGVLFTGGFLPEASLVRASTLEFDPASGGPVVDQDGRCSDPAYFAAGNVLRPIETAGWSFREGRRIADAVADDLQASPRIRQRQIRITTGPGIRYALPQRISVYESGACLPPLQMRVDRATQGSLTIRNENGVLASQRIRSRPERRILVDRSEITIPDGTDELKLEIR
jgi:NADPH-dependent 2,4-dienoyl-CoA reductase/sulfur reductase-like enzyme